MKAKKLILILATVVAASSAFAQGGRGFGMMQGGMGGSPVMLLGREDVQDDLKLTDDQKSKLSTIRDTQQSKMRETFQAAMQNGGSREEMQKRMQEIVPKMMAEVEKEINSVLTADQQKRIREIGIQMAGNRAVMQKDVQKELGITEDQRTKVETLVKRQGEANRSIREKIQSGEIDPSQVRELMEKNNKALDDEIGKVLTDAQKTKLKDLGGRKFERRDQN